MRSRILPVIIFFGIFFPTFSYSQRWTITDPSLIPVTGIRDIIPTRFAAFHIDHKAIYQILSGALDESTQPLASSSTLLTVGLADGSTDVFKIVAYSMMEDELKMKYPEIRTFRGISTSDPYRTLRADWTNNGFRAVIREPGMSVYIDPFQRNDLNHCIAYFKNDIRRTDEWNCGFEEENSGIQETHSPTQRMFGDCMFRSYRLAVAATGEYSNYFGATSAAQEGLVLSEVVTAVNRLNEVYEVDFTVRLILIGNTTSVFYYNPGTDPYSGSACTQLTQNQTTMDDVIGSANYDIGHVFSVGSGGCASSGLCSVTAKARGATGLNPPIGDPFYIDYVAHEIGHQFGGSHTFNGIAGSCNGNRVSSSAYEPGSGSTIMAYAGICGSQNLQPNSDAYFHARSLLQVANTLSSTGCAAFISFPNTAPIATSTPDYTIPISTPFVLTAQATDADGDPLTYCWEQYDLESTSSEPPAANDIDGPMFRSFDPVTIPQRYFPRLADLTQNISPMWEVLPSVSRSMTFRMTVRDYHDIAGCTDEDDVVVMTNSIAGPFTVTSQNAGDTWLEASNQTITWDVANTTASPINCANVELRLSYDGGLTYPALLAASEPNDGSATITVPPGTTSEARVMVKASNNIFFDINNADIIIEIGLPNFTISLDPASISECNDGTVQTTVNVGSFMGFSDPVTLTLLIAPPGAVVTFIPQIVLPGNSSTLTISNLGSLQGSYTPTVRGTSTTGNKDALFTINLLGIPTASPSLLLPANSATDVLMTPLLDWSSVSGITQYGYEVANDVDFENIVLNGVALTDQYQVMSGLYALTQYYWRVRSVNMCGVGPWSTVFSFTTSSCFALLSPDVPVAIPENGTPTVTSTFTTGIELEITDLNIISLIGTHTWIDDLQFFLKSPEQTEILFWDRPCGNNVQNFNINFDDEAGNQPHPCPPTNGGTYKPSNPLTPFDNENSAGTWTLKIMDLFNQDGGSLNSWGLKVCGIHPCELLVTETSGTGPGTLPGAINCASAGDTIFLSASLSGQTIDVGAAPLVIDENIKIISLADDINVTSSGLRPFEVTPGMAVDMRDMMITAGTSVSGGAILNQGTLTLTNVVIEENPSVPGATLIHNDGGTLRLRGNCSMQQ